MPTPGTAGARGARYAAPLRDLPPGAARVPHLIADVPALGPRLAQMALGFGADELFGPIVSERALRLGDNAHNPALTRKEAAT